MVVCVVGSYYIELRGANGTQKEHMDIVPACADVVKVFPLAKDRDRRALQDMEHTK